MCRNGITQALFYYYFFLTHFRTRVYFVYGCSAGAGRLHRSTTLATAPPPPPEAVRIQKDVTYFVVGRIGYFRFYILFRVRLKWRVGDLRPELRCPDGVVP